MQFYLIAVVGRASRLILQTGVVPIDDLIDAIQVTAGEDIVLVLQHMGGSKFPMCTRNAAQAKKLMVAEGFGDLASWNAVRTCLTWAPYFFARFTATLRPFFAKLLQRIREAAFQATPAADAARVSSPPPKLLAILQAADMAYQVEGEFITPAEFEDDSRWIRAVKAHRAAAAHQPITSTPPASTLSNTPALPPNTTPTTTTLRRHAPLPRLPAEDFKIVFRPGGGLDLRTTTNGALLQTLCTLATIDYATARAADRVRINPYNNSLTVSTPSESHARIYLRVSELRLGSISYPLRAYMAAPDNALRGIIYNAVDSQTQEEIIQDLQSMNVNTPYAIADARQMGRSKSILITFVGTTTLPSSIVFNCGVYRCHPFRPKAEACTNCWTPGHRADVCTKPKSALCCRCGQAHSTVEPPTCVPCCILCKEAHLTGSRPCKLRFDRTGPSPSTHSKPQPPPPAPPTGPILKSSRPSRPRRRSTSRGARSTSRHRSPHTSDSKIAALEATIAAQQLQIQELSLQLQAALAPEESMNTAPSAASSRASSPTRRPPHKRRSPSSDAIAPHERDVVRETASFLEAFEQRFMARFARLEERVVAIDTRVAAIESHLSALDTRVAALEARQSATEATLAHLSLPAPLTPAPTPTPPGWNCRRFRGKRSTLQLHLQNIPPDTIPSILALQEPLAPVKLRDYTSFHPSSEAHPNVATLVHRNLTAVLHQLNVSDCAHLLLEILPRRRTEASLFVLNVYSPPKAASAPLLLVLRKALSCAGRNALIVDWDRFRSIRLIPLLLLSPTSLPGLRPFWRTSALPHPQSLQHPTPLRQTAVCCTSGRPITLSTAGGRPRSTIAVCASVWLGSLLTNALAEYGRVKSVTFATVANRQKKLNAVRVARTEMSKPVPNFATISGHGVMFEYRGMRRVCARCGGTGHMATACSALYCKRCGTFGHDTEGCEAQCKRCGGRHGTRECFRRKSYVAVARGLTTTSESTSATPSTSGMQVLRPRNAQHPKKTPDYLDGDFTKGSDATSAVAPTTVSQTDTQDSGAESPSASTEDENSGSSESAHSPVILSPDSSPASYSSVEEQEVPAGVGPREGETTHPSEGETGANDNLTGRTYAPDRNDNRPIVSSGSYIVSEDKHHDEARGRATSTDVRLRRSKANETSSDSDAALRAQTKKARKCSLGEGAPGRPEPRSCNGNWRLDQALLNDEASVERLTEKIRLSAEKASPSPHEWDNLKATWKKLLQEEGKAR
ncbi:hypothetical protein HPB52_023336 [Rhipicephalus sanguineus]|uniref:CCHC-type domain-containing protein n=1 Tax=Rhipicephalus sanguineus TaxID=34632 RepID=A0A9D4QC15_RHISA|nr:hypothetical protein HPB52_023336 [Rhipicephalus sanguineus]